MKAQVREYRKSGMHIGRTTFSNNLAPYKDELPSKDVLGMFTDGTTVYLHTEFDAVPVVVEGEYFDFLDAPYGAYENGGIDNGHEWTCEQAEKLGFTWKNMF